jgi:hypothetical protein
MKVAGREQEMTTDRRVSAVVVLFLLLSAAPALAFEILPEATDLDGKVRQFKPPLRRYFDEAVAIGAERFRHPVHERVTHQIYGCPGGRDECSLPVKPHRYAPDAVIAGVRWNDNPPFELESSKSLQGCVGKTIRLPNFMDCWFLLFKDAERRARAGEVFDANSGVALLYRVHFGDMQFLHSMASRDKERARDTLERMMMWAEFAYRTALGEVDRGIELRKTGIPGMELIFRNKGWTAQQLFTRGDPTLRGEKDFRDLAFGSLLHMVQDSFVLSHTDRDEASSAKCPKVEGALKPGQIRSFHSYARQDKKKHAREDGQDALDRALLVQQPNVVDVGRLLKSYYDARRPWTELRDYLECVFEAQDLEAEAGPGEQFVSD